jgi:glutathionylspermidine synthase
MQRITSTPRENWEKKVEEHGLVYHHHALGELYWNEAAYYKFTMAEVDEMEEATNKLHHLCLEAVERIIDSHDYTGFNLPFNLISLIEWSWMHEETSIYGRFDLCYNGKYPPKLLEYNADTPTTLLEASVIQWFWLQDMFPKADQFNSIHERLIERWKHIKTHLEGAYLYFGYSPDNAGEDRMTVTYMQETAEEAEIATATTQMSQIGWNPNTNKFVDINDKSIVSIFKLYPWEWMFEEDFIQNLVDHYKEMQWIEPLWKILLSNKAILAKLWEYFPYHENLLECYMADSQQGTIWMPERYVKKPVYSREGCNVAIFEGDKMTHHEGPYGECNKWIYQEYAPLPEFDGMHPVIGSWVIDGESAGIGIRESPSLITDNLSMFAPHLIEG